MGIGDKKNENGEECGNKRETKMGMGERKNGNVEKKNGNVG